MDSKSLLLAAAISGLAFSAVATEKTKGPIETKEETTVKGECHGANSCKGTSACHTATNSCAGTNSCKGKGWLKTTEKDCKAKKGTFKSA